MDSNQFDDLIRQFAAPASRRSSLRSLGGGIAAAALSLFGWQIREDASARNALKKCKKKKGKKKKKCIAKAKKQNPTQLDEAPPCTSDSCQLPPGCSQATLDECTASLREALLVDAESCRSVCAAPDSAPCRDCLAPFVAARFLDAEECAAKTCNAAALQSGSAGEAPARNGRAEAGQRGAARAWWVRSCPGECCYIDYSDCKEEARDEWIICMGGAVASCFATGPGCAAVALFCMSKLAYDDYKCAAKKGCPDGSWCKEGDICCPGFSDVGCNGSCCASGLCMACVGGTCQDTCGNCEYCAVGGICKSCGEWCCGGRLPDDAVARPA